VAGEHSHGLASFRRDDVKRNKRQAFGVIRNPEVMLRRGWIEPFQQVDLQTTLQAATHHADLRQQIPDIRPLDGCRNDQQDWFPWGGFGRLVSPESSTRHFDNDPGGCLERAEPGRVERLASAPAGLVKEVKKGANIALSSRASSVVPAILTIDPD